MDISITQCMQEWGIGEFENGRLEIHRLRSLAHADTRLWTTCTAVVWRSVVADADVAGVADAR